MFDQPSDRFCQLCHRNLLFRLYRVCRLSQHVSNAVSGYFLSNP
ncbi:hypothetical protein THTE_3991 [Thermogutta terrifontis]|uniref:Uncharacterized protein n=1 Tax=Thermogutta terrifontis TaxID=1331910 RepID=A0A286RKW8_9BACT|nr:hypothetical protein THTE_3991 [Thermogutta terrifontis]